MADQAMTRRQAVRVGLGLSAAPLMLAAGPKARMLRFQLVETAGLRRFGYPVRTVLPAAIPEGTKFRLMKAGRAVSAQCRPFRDLNGRRVVILDFNASPGPFETEDYVITYGEDIEAGREPGQGIRVERQGTDFIVSNGPHLRYRVAKNLAGFLEEVSNSRHPFVTEKSGGLSFADRNGQRYSWGDDSALQQPVKGTISREGPLAIGLDFDATHQTRGGPVVSSGVGLTFPSSKSWVEAIWQLNDPEGNVASMALDLKLRLTDSTTLVDLGASSTVYGQLRGQERMVLEAGRGRGLADSGPSWLVRKGPPGALAPLAEAPRHAPAPAEGWAHVMDQSVCTAIAVRDFGRATHDAIEIAAGGGVRLQRDFAKESESPPRGRKTFAFWLHFVPMPVQVGAATSPQAMLAPLEVRWQDRAT